MTNVTAWPDVTNVPNVTGMVDPTDVSDVTDVTSVTFRFVTAEAGEIFANSA